LLEKAPARTAIVRERIAYYLSCRAEIACAENDFARARLFARRGMFDGGGPRVTARCLAIFSAAPLAAVWCRRKWGAQNGPATTAASATPGPSPATTRPLFFNRRPRWGLAWRGWLALVLLVALVALVWLHTIQPFLAQTRRVDTKVLVVEGWVHEYACRAAWEEFQAGHYDKIYTTGGPVVGSGNYLNVYNTSASVGAELLVKVGLPAGLVQMVPSYVNGRDRTYSSALALREYFRTNGVPVKSFNVLTEDAHARRTRMLFQRAFGPDAQVGIISVPDPDYDPVRWWRYSEGVREVLGENIAWVYAAFLFHPGPPPPI
jgi:hypothetical protein